MQVISLSCLKPVLLNYVDKALVSKESLLRRGKLIRSVFACGNEDRCLGIGGKGCQYLRLCLI